MYYGTQFAFNIFSTCISYETWNERQRTDNKQHKKRKKSKKYNEKGSRWIMVILGLLLNKTS